MALASARYTEGTRPTVESSSDYYGLNFPIAPRRIEGRLAPVSWADIGADIGWLDGGVDVRFGVPAAPGRFWVGSLALGVRSGQPGPFKQTRGTHSYWARLEGYPLLHESKNESHRAVVALGLNGGVFFHHVPDGSSDRGAFNEFATNVFREELRVETALGYFLNPSTSARLLLAMEPYWVFKGNDGSGGPPGSSFEQSWGMVFVLSGSIFLRAHQPDDAK